MAAAKAASADEQAVEHYGAEDMPRQFESLRELLTKDLSQDAVDEPAGRLALPPLSPNGLPLPTASP